MATGLERALITVDIKGKAYVTVNERIKYFREHFTVYRLISEIVYQKDAEYLTWDDKGETKGAWRSAEICFKASILNEKGEIVGPEINEDQPLKMTLHLLLLVVQEVILMFLV